MKKSSYVRFQTPAAIFVIMLVVAIGIFIVRHTLASGADVNNDGIVGIADLSIIAAHFGLSGQTATTGDTNGDGIVGIVDLSILAAAWGSTVPTCTGVTMTNGQADIDSHPAGTTYCITGVHNWMLRPKTGDKYIGSGSAVLDGQNTTSFAFYVFNLDADNVTISNLEIRNYITYGGQLGAVLASQNFASTGWTLDNLQVHDNGNSAGGSGATLGPGWKVIGGRYYNNRQSAFNGALPEGVVIDGTEMDHNNFTNDSYTAPNVDCGNEGGGFKWAGTTTITIKNSKVHDNACRGLWADGSGNGAIITNNQVYNNWAEGIFIEISSNALITGNTVYGNSSHEPDCAVFAWGGGITNAESDHVEVANNNVYGNCRGITGLQQNRPDGNPGLLQDYYVHDNSIAGPGGTTGVAADNGADLTTRNIRFINNTFSNGMNFCNLTC